MILIVILAIIIICAVEGPGLIRNGLRKELSILAILLGIALLLAIGKKLGMPAPLSLVNNLISPLGKSFFQNH